ncbi:hypothetical protein [Pseudomonas chlororaphis]|uniref:ORC-CDC6 family AAA ATPase n=1 Tax=Pseudomonas chlororaphis TaxID=587753 RepID=UPI002368DC06|nr:hypothetical protein [Pseudomonas chlororaphis]WDH32849.1 hypothetical protein PUP62_18495 [Pseudomonas chlororaphis]WDH38931.1 hypothetical protein PUP51_18490 [Pseudomonas chlororaphis]
MASPINTAVMKLKLRAERSTRDHLIQTFVDVDPLLTLLQTEDHQILYGRRGTGKTHALEYLASDRDDAGDLPLYLDMRLIGSSGGLYSDPNIPLAERATRLLVDTLQAVHEQMLNTVVEQDDVFDGSIVFPLLDNYLEAASQVVVSGVVTSESGAQGKSTRTKGAALTAGIKKIPEAQLSLNIGDALEEQVNYKRTQTGGGKHRVHFGTLNRCLLSLCKSLQGKRVWGLLDEWSEIPLDLQPFLADLIRRSLMTVPLITVKIGAIEQRTNFRVADGATSYIGVEVGADMTANTNLDDFMVFDNDQAKASEFFENLIYKHLKSELPEGYLDSTKPSQDLLRRMFTQSSNTFGEFVRAAEGVPRDAINILIMSAQLALDDPISIPNIRVAAKRWFQQGKEQALRDSKTTALLRWIIDEVIAHRQAKAFLMRSDAKHPIIEMLFDARILHIVKKGVSSNETPGVRYDVYGIDYGCYVDLMNTVKAPKGLFEASKLEGESGFVDVPATDYRSIRRAILDIERFEEAQTI